MRFAAPTTFAETVAELPVDVLAEVLRNVDIGRRYRFSEENLVSTAFSTPRLEALQGEVVTETRLRGETPRGETPRGDSVKEAVAGLEAGVLQRFQARKAAAAASVKQEVARKQEEERKRKQEEERKRQEEERRRQELEKRKEEEQKKKEEERKKKEEQQRQRAAEAAAEAAAQERARKAKLGLTDWDAVAAEFQRHKDTIADIKTSINGAVAADKPLKLACSRLKRQINPRFGQLNNSMAQLSTIQDAVAELVRLAQQANPLAFQWILNFIAKALVLQAGSEISTAPARAVPLALLARGLCQRFPELERLLTARLVKKCPFVIGYTGPIDTEEGRQAMGWKRSSDDRWESETKYNERVGGIMLFYAVLTRLAVSHPGASPDVYPPASAWRMLARVANTPHARLQNAHFVCIANWWDAAAQELLQAYGRQGTKMLTALWDPWTLSVAERKLLGAARLRVLGEGWHESGRVELFKPMET